MRERVQGTPAMRLGWITVAANQVSERGLPSHHVWRGIEWRRGLPADGSRQMQCGVLQLSVR